MEFENNPRSIKYYIRKYLIANKELFKGKKVLDFPAGNGITSKILKDIGAIPIPMDLFPEYFNVEGIKCNKVNIRDGLPIEDKSVDEVICQEGIEHFSDQFEAFKEFYRVLKISGILLITTPNYSSLRAKLSYLLLESERFNSKMPPNELDSIWMIQQDNKNDIYFGHIFLLGIQKLRVLTKLSGFQLKKYHFTRFKSTSLFLFPFFYPFIFFSNFIAFRRNMKSNKDYDYKTKRKIYGEVFKLAINPKILVGKNLMTEFIKEQDADQVVRQLKSKHKDFSIT